MSLNLQRYRSAVLPFALLMGFFFHHYIAKAVLAVPYLIFFILFLNFSALDIHKMKLTALHWILLLFQGVVGVLGYLLVQFYSEVLAQGVLIAALCPVAAAVVVVACMLGANRETITAYTILGNAGIALLAPLCFSFIGTHVDDPFLDSFKLIFCKIFPIIVLPLLLILLLQRVAPRVNAAITKVKGISFYLWAMALMITISQTLNFIYAEGAGHGRLMIELSVISLIFCVIQFAFGKWVGKRYGDKVAGGQALGQRNTALGIWMATNYLNPLVSIVPATYSIWQNLFNSWQLWQHDRRQKVDSSTHAGDAQ